MPCTRYQIKSQHLRVEELEPRLVMTSGQPLGFGAWLQLIWQSESLVAHPIISPPAQAVSAPSIEVHAGQSIQSAIDAAAPGTVIFIDPGTYKQALTISKPDIFLVGLNQPSGGSVLIENPGGADNGINVTSQGAGFVLLNVTVQGFDANGVVLTGVRRFFIDQVHANNNGEYGIFPILSLNGLITRSSASGSNDTGIYVGQSVNVGVLGNTVFGNVNGIEIENTVNAVVAGNYSHDNTAGILVDVLPGLTVPAAQNIVVENNFVRANNLANFGPPGIITSLIPSGAGILVLGASQTNVRNNAVLGNDKIGIGVLSTELLSLLGQGPVVGIEPDPNNTQIINNVVLGAPLGADLLWDGSGTGNAWIDNVFQTSLSPGPLPDGA